MDSGGQTVERNLQVQGVLAAGRRWQGTGRLALAIGIENLVGIRLAFRAGSRETHYIRSFAGGDGMHVPGAVRGSRRKIGLRKVRKFGHSSVLFTTVGFLWFVTLLTPPRMPKRYLPSLTRHSKCRFRLKYSGYR